MGTLLSKLPRQSKPGSAGLDELQNVSAFGFSSDDSWYVSGNDSYDELSLAEFIKQQKSSGGDISEVKGDISVDGNHEGQGDITTHLLSNPTSESNRIASEEKDNRYKGPNAHEMGDRAGTFVKTSCGGNQTHNNASINRIISTDIGVGAHLSFDQNKAQKEKRTQNTTIVNDKNQTDNNCPLNTDLPSRMTRDTWQCREQPLGQTEEHTCDGEQITLNEILAEAGLREDTKEIDGFQKSAQSEPGDRHEEIEQDGYYRNGHFYHVGGQHECNEVTIEYCSCQEGSPYTTMTATATNNEYNVHVGNTPTSRDNEKNDLNPDVKRCGRLGGLQLHLTSGRSDPSAKIGAGDSLKSDAKEDSGWIFQSIKSAMLFGNNSRQDRIGDETIANDKYKDTNVDSGKGEVIQSKGKREHKEYRGDNSNAQDDSRGKEFGTVDTIVGKNNNTNLEIIPNKDAHFETFNFLADPKNASFGGSVGGNKGEKTNDFDMESSPEIRKMCSADDENDDGHVDINQTNKSYKETNKNNSPTVSKKKVDAKLITVEIDTGSEWKQTKPRKKTFRHFLQESDSPTLKDNGVCGDANTTSRFGLGKDENNQKRKSDEGQSGWLGRKIERLERIYRSDSEESLELKELYEGGLLTRKEFDKMMTIYRDYGLVETNIDTQSTQAPFLGKNYNDDHSYGNDDDVDIDNYDNDNDHNNDQNNYPNNDHDDDEADDEKTRKYWVEELRNRNALGIVSEVERNFSKFGNDNNEDYELSYRERVDDTVKDGSSDVTTCLETNTAPCDANTDADLFDYAALDKMLSDERKKRVGELKINKLRQWMAETYTDALDLEKDNTSTNEKESETGSSGGSIEQEFRENHHKTDSSYFSIRQDGDKKRDDGFVRKESTNLAQRKHGVELTAYKDDRTPYNANLYNSTESKVFGEEKEPIASWYSSNSNTSKTEDTSNSNCSPYQNEPKNCQATLFTKSDNRGDPEMESIYCYHNPSVYKNKNQTSIKDNYNEDKNVQYDAALNNLFHSHQSKFKFACERLCYKPPDSFPEKPYFLDDDDCEINDDDYALHGAWLKPLMASNHSANLNYYEDQKDANIVDGNNDGSGNRLVDYAGGSRVHEDNSCVTLLNAPNVHAGGFEGHAIVGDGEDANCTVSHVLKLTGHSFAWYTDKTDETPNGNDDDECKSPQRYDGTDPQTLSPDQSSPQYTNWRNVTVDDVVDAEYETAIFEEDDGKELQQEDCAVDDDKMQVLPGNPFSLLFKAAGMYNGDYHEGSSEVLVANAQLQCNQSQASGVRTINVSNDCEQGDGDEEEKENAEENPEGNAEETESQDAGDNNGNHDEDDDDNNDEGIDNDNNKYDVDEINVALPNPIDATFTIIETTAQYCDSNNSVDCDDDLDISANHNESQARAADEECNVTNNKLCENENDGDNARGVSIPDNYDDFCQGREDEEKEDKEDKEDEEEDDEKESEKEEENREVEQEDGNDEEVAPL